MNSTKLMSWNVLIGSVLAVLLLVPTAAAQTSQDSAPGQLFGACPADDLDDQRKAIQYSLYYENYKNEAYRSAVPYLRWMLQCAPTFNGPGRVGERNFERAIKTYEALAEEAETTEETTAYLDSALAVFDLALETMNEQDVEYDAYEWAFKRGYFLHRNGGQVPDDAGDAAEYYLEAFEIDPDQLKPYYINYTINSLMESGDRERALEVIRQIESERGDEPEVSEIVNTYLDDIPPEERATFLERRLEDDPGNVDVMLQLFDLYEQIGNRQEMYRIGNMLQEAESGPRITRRVATMYIEDGEYAEAFELLEEMIQNPDVEPRAEDYFNMGVAQEQMDRLSSARTYYRKALEVDSSYGRAHLAIGGLYAKAIGNCTGGRSLEREDRAVYWLVVDEYQRAKDADPALAQTANQSINTYHNYYPTAEDLFFWNKTEGDSYAVDYGCYAWINETTTVRRP